jgi:hypothetical protein
VADDHIATYLNDHLAGSVAAVELMENLETVYAGNPIAGFIAELRADVEADREELESLMSRLQISESRTRKASAWLTEKFTELKLRLDDSARGDLRLFESLEALSLGIEGKRSLWIALAAAAQVSSQLQIVDYQRLKQRAEDQRDRVEKKRVEVAKTALKLEHSS